MPHHSGDAEVKRAVFLSGCVAAAAAGASLRALGATEYPVTHTEAQWRALLGPARYRILREGGTETANSSPLLAETRVGTYRCAGCSLALFASNMKYDSGDGWPAFRSVLPHAVLEQSDYQLIEQRTEVHCRRCGGHLGHLFDDGPAPAFQRYCIDGLALNFVPR